MLANREEVQPRLPPPLLGHVVNMEHTVCVSKSVGDIRAVMNQKCHLFRTSYLTCQPLRVNAEDGSPLTYMHLRFIRSNAKLGYHAQQQGFREYRRPSCQTPLRVTTIKARSTEYSVPIGYDITTEYGVLVVCLAFTHLHDSDALEVVAYIRRSMAY